MIYFNPSLWLRPGWCRKLHFHGTQCHAVRFVMIISNFHVYHHHNNSVWADLGSRGGCAHFHSLPPCENKSRHARYVDSSLIDAEPGLWYRQECILIPITYAANTYKPFAVWVSCLMAFLLTFNFADGALDPVLPIDTVSISHL